MAGLGGVGKTQIALEFTYRFAYEYDTIWWLGAETPQAMQQAAVEFLARKKLPEVCENEAVVCGAFASWFEQNERWLLVFDNVDDFDAITPFLPKNNNGNVLITTRLQRGFIGKKMDIAVFDEDEAVAFLLRRTGLKDKTDAAKLAARLGYLPLALEQAAAYIQENNGVDFEKYIALLEQYSLKVFEQNEHITNYSQPVTETWLVSLEKMTVPSARQLMGMLAHCAPDRIPLRIFEQHADYLPEPLRSEMQNEISRGKIVRELTKYSLVKAEESGDGGLELSMHRLLQEVVASNTLPEEEANQLLIIGVMMRETLEDAEREEYNYLLPHALSVATFLDERRVDSIDFYTCLVELFVEIGAIYMCQGDRKKEQEYFEKALFFFDNVVKLHSKTYFALGLFFAHTKNYEAALKCYRAIENSEPTLHEINNAVLYECMGDAYNRMEKFDEALGCFQKVLEIRREQLGEDDLITISVYSLISDVLEQAGRMKEAQDFYTAEYKILHRFLKHTESTHAYARMGTLCEKTGDYENASANYIAALALEKKVQENDLAWVGMRCHDLAVVNRRMERFAEAMEWYQKALVY